MHWTILPLAASVDGVASSRALLPFDLFVYWPLCASSTTLVLCSNAFIICLCGYMRVHRYKHSRTHNTYR